MLLQGFVNLRRGFVDVHMNACVRLRDQNAHFFKTVVADGIGSVRTERNADPWVVLEIVEKSDALTQRFACVAGSRNAEIHYRNGDLSSHPTSMYDFTSDIWKEIHVRKAGDTALQLLGNRQFRAGLNEGFVNPAIFRRPDVVVQPILERKVVSKSAKQGHRCMPMRIDQPWCEKHVRQLQDAFRCMLVSLQPRSDQDDTSVTNTQAMLPKNYARRLDRNEPGRKKEEIQLFGVEF